MKRVLITGKGSYIGTKVEEWLKKVGHEVDVLDMMGDEWKKYDFHGYDSVYHVAGIAHRKDAPDDLYEQVNHILAVDVAKKAAEAEVKQFVFMSSGAVYSQSDKKHKKIVVDEYTPLTPTTSYGISKMKAEQDLRMLDTTMKIAVIRPPMVYGPGAKGNYKSLSELAKKTPIFPRINNIRSMIYIDNLCEFVRLLIESGEDGLFLPQNKEYVNVSELVKQIAGCNGKQILLTPIFNWAVYLSGLVFNSINKVFGDFYYKKSIYFNNMYQLVDSEASIEYTEGLFRGS